MEFFKKAKEKALKAKEVFARMKEAAVDKQTMPKEEEQLATVTEQKTEEQKLRDTINDNIEHGKEVAASIEELRFVLNKTERFDVQMENIDNMLTAVQDKLSAAVDVVVDVSGLDRSANEMITMLKENAGTCSTENWINGFEALCNTVVKYRFSGDIRIIRQSEFALDVLRLDIAIVENKKALDIHKNSRLEVQEKMLEYMKMDKDTTQLNALSNQLDAQIKTAEASVTAYEGLKKVYEVQLDTMKALPNNISAEEYQNRISTIMMEHTEQTKLKAAELERVHQASLMVGEMIKMRAQEIEDLLPGVSMESRQETERILNVAKLEGQKQQMKEEQAHEQEEEQTVEQSELLNN